MSEKKLTAKDFVPGARARSIEYLKVRAVTSCPDGGEKRNPGRYVNAYVRPPSETLGMDSAIFGPDAVTLRGGRVWIVEELRAGRILDIPRDDRVRERRIPESMMPGVLVRRCMTPFARTAGACGFWSATQTRPFAIASEVGG